MTRTEMPDEVMVLIDGSDHSLMTLITNEIHSRQPPDIFTK
jgi:DNA-directed RNA polymerase subunit L